MSQTTDIAEKNARVSARGEYMRWLAKRFGDLDLLLTLQGEDRVNLRKVYVPLRIDTQDRSDDSMGGPDKVKDEGLPGRDALEVIAEQPFVAISGRPGSGKTTLIQAVISELTGERPSEFRRKVVGERGILPIPLILREYQDDLLQIHTIDDLLDSWWRKAEQEARDKGFTLDLPRLRASYSPSGDGIPLLLLFDGIDEVGGVERRQWLMSIAYDAPSHDNRAVVTGRPSGFADLPMERLNFMARSFFGALRMPGSVDDYQVGARDLTIALSTAADTPTPVPLIDKQPEALRSVAPADAFSTAMVRGPIRLHHAQPFAWPQIRGFTDRFFRLRQEWRVERERVEAELVAALSDVQRAHLLTLARRPIFLTLMALVHANDRRIPHGRADLYRRIVDLYLVRQTQQRRLVLTTKGEPMPHWDEREVRRALGFVAWRSQHKGAKVKDAGQRDNRQVIWNREDLTHELRHLLSGEDPALGRFTDLKPEDAPRLLDYFLHPTGLLVDPAEGRYQFAHLSFQEYLCAEYIHGRAKAMGSRRFLDGIRELLYENLGLPGWDEVGLLLLCIHSAEGAQTERTAHLELLAELDLADLPQARLLIAALTGKELDYADNELLRWLPIAVAAALVHPPWSLAMRFRAVTNWVKPGRMLLGHLFNADDVFEPILAHIKGDPPAGLAPGEWGSHSVSGSARERWHQPRAYADRGMYFGEVEARSHALLALANDCGWIRSERGNEALVPLSDAELEIPILNWLRAEPRNHEPGLLYWRTPDNSEVPRLPIATATALELGRLVADQGPLWRYLSTRVPLDAWLLEGEWINPQLPFFISTPIVWLGLYPNETLQPVPRLSLGLYQVLVLAEASLSIDLHPIFYLSRLLAHSYSQIGPRSPQLLEFRRRSLERSRALLQLQSRSRSLSRLEAKSALMSLQADPAARPMPVRKVVQELQEQVQRWAEHWRKFAKMPPTGIEHRFSSIDWFDQQAEDPDLMHRRGLRPGEPLPREFGLFDATGRIKEQLPRESVVRLRAWVENDDAVLAWFFPEGLSPEDDKDLREQLHILHHYERPDGGHGQPWSPIAALDAVLADWPPEQPTREVTLAAAERDLTALLDESIATEAAGDQPKAPRAGIDRPDIA